MSPSLVLVLVLSKVPAPFAGKVVGVSACDAVMVMNEGTERKAKLNAVDCPDLQQDHGVKAKELTRTLILGKDVRVEPKFVDRDGRILGEVVLADGKSLSYELVRAGFARWNERRAPNYAKLKTLEMDAKRAQLGMWAIAAPAPAPTATATATAIATAAPTPSVPSAAGKTPPSDYAAVCAIAAKYDAAKLASDPATIASFGAEVDNAPKSAAFRVTWSAAANASPSDKWKLFKSGAEEAGVKDFKCPALEKLWKQPAAPH